jgi:hypothetical protein
MRLYQAQHRAYCGVDLHARAMFLCVLDRDGRTLLHHDIPTTRGDAAPLAPFGGTGTAEGVLVRFGPTTPTRAAKDARGSVGCAAYGG